MTTLSREAVTDALRAFIVSEVGEDHGQGMTQQAERAADVVMALARPENEVKAEAVQSAATAIREDKGASSWIVTWLNEYADDLRSGGVS